MSSEARGATFVAKIAAGVAIGAISPIRVVFVLEVIAVVNVVVVIIVIVVVTGMVSDTSDVVGTCCKCNQFSSLKLDTRQCILRSMRHTFQGYFTRNDI